MAKGYWVVNIDVTDGDRIGKYVEAVTPFLEGRGARYLARGGAYEAKEGETRAVNVIVEFPDYASALECYASDEYQAIAADRLAASEGDFVILEGV